MDNNLWIERWPSPDRAALNILAASSDRRIIDAAWRAAQVLGIGPKLLLRDERNLLAEWEPVHFSGKP